MIFVGNIKSNIITDDYIKSLTDYSYIDTVCLCVPLIYIAKYKKALNDAGIFIGSQCVDLDEDFANRGEVNAKMLKDVGCEFVFLGQKIGKKITANDYIRIRKKIVSVIENGMKVFVCIGESMEDKECNQVLNVLEKQIKEIFKGIENYITDDNLIISYEPKWAVGTGLSINAEDLKNIMINLRSMVDVYSKKKKCKILYGGSCNFHNIPRYLESECVDGFVIGNACLNKKQFTRILCGERK